MLSAASGSSGERVGVVVGATVGVGVEVVGVGVGVTVAVFVEESTGVGEGVSGVGLGVGSEPAAASRVMGERAVGVGEGDGLGVGMGVSTATEGGVGWTGWLVGAGVGVEDGPQAVTTRVMVRASSAAARVVVASFVNGGLFGFGDLGISVSVYDFVGGMDGCGVDWFPGCQAWG